MKNVYNREIITEDEEDYDVDIEDFDSFNDDILNEINSVRERPEQYVSKVEDLYNSIKNQKEKYFFMGNVPYAYQDLHGSFKDGIKFLKSQKKLPKLEYDRGISNSCEDLVYKYAERKNTQNSFQERLNKYGIPFGESYEIINFDIFDPEFIVINLILSDGDKNKFGRNVIFNPNIKYFGIASTILPPNKVLVVIDFCEEFEFDGENIPINIQNKFKTKQNSYNSNEIPSKKVTNIEKNDKDIKLRDPRKRLNEKKKRDIFYYDLDNLDEEEFFEKEFDTNFGKYEKEKNSFKKMFSTVATDEKGKQRTIFTTIIETVDKNGLKKGYYIEKAQKGSKYLDGRPQEQIEKEKRDMEFLKEMERKEKERIKNEKNRKKIKEIPIKLNGKIGEYDTRENIEEPYEGDERENLPEGAVGMEVKHKEIIDKGEPALEITKIITYGDGSIQKIINKQPLKTM